MANEAKADDAFFQALGNNTATIAAIAKDAKEKDKGFTGTRENCPSNVKGVAKFSGYYLGLTKASKKPMIILNGSVVIPETEKGKQITRVTILDPSNSYYSSNLEYFFQDLQSCGASLDEVKSLAEPDPIRFKDLLVKLLASLKEKKQQFKFQTVDSNNTEFPVNCYFNECVDSITSKGEPETTDNVVVATTSNVVVEQPNEATPFDFAANDPSLDMFNGSNDKSIYGV